MAGAMNDPCHWYPVKDHEDYDHKPVPNRKRVHCYLRADRWFGDMLIPRRTAEQSCQREPAMVRCDLLPRE